MEFEGVACEQLPLVMKGKTFMSVEILARSNDEAMDMKKRAEMFGEEVRNTKVWDGPCPDGSFIYINMFMRMSSPEYFILRHVWYEDDLIDAISFVNEMVGCFQTSLSCSDIADGEYVECSPQTTIYKLKRYLSQISDTPEGEKAMVAVLLATEGLGSPSEARDAAIAQVSKYLG